MSGEAADPAHVESQSIRLSLPCVGCGYQLRGLSLDAACPECGRLVSDTVGAVLDPAASGLPQLRNPRSVGLGLLAVVSTIALGAVLLVARPLAGRIEGYTGAVPGRWLQLAPGWVPFAAAASFGAALAAVWLLAPPPGAREQLVAVGIRRLRSGLLVLAAGSLGLGILDPIPPLDARERVVLGVMGGAAVWTLYALRRVTRVIGDRSRAYRTGRGARQGFRELVAAVIGVVVGDGAAAVGRAAELELVAMMGLLVAWVSIFMLLVGLAYLVVNAGWILRALVSPPPTLAAILGGGTGEAHAGRRGSSESASD